MSYETPEVNGYTEPEVEPVTRVGWSPEAATTYASRVSQASGGLPQDEVSKIIQELVGSGKSSSVDDVKMRLREDKKRLTLETAASIIPEVGLDAATRVAEEGLAEEVDDDDLLEDSAIDATLAAGAYEGFSAASYEKWGEKEKKLRKEYSGVRPQIDPFGKGAAENVLNFLGAFAPYSEANSWRRLAGKLEDKFAADFGPSGKAYLLQGEVSAEIRDWFDDMDTSDQIEALKYIGEVLPEVAGYFGENEFLAAGMLSTIVEGAEGGRMEGELDTTRIVDNIFSILEVGGSLGTILETVKYAKGLKDVRSNVAKLERLDKEQAAELEARVLEGDEEAAAVLGVDSGTIIADTYLPKWSSYEETPHISEGFFKNMLEKVRDVTRRGSQINLHMTDAEKLHQAGKTEEALAASTRGTLWSNASKVEATDNGIKVTARFGDNAESGFKTQKEAEDYLRWMQQRNPELKGAVVGKVHNGEAVTLKVNTTGDTPDLMKVRAKLVEEAGGALERGSRKGGKAAGKAYRKDTRELALTEDAIKFLRGESIDNPTAVRMAEATLGVETQGNRQLSKTAKKKAISQLETEKITLSERIRKVDADEAAQMSAQEAKANLVRFDQGQYDKLTGEAKRAYDDAVADAGKTTPKVDEAGEAIDDGDEFFVDLDYTSNYKADAGQLAFNIDDIHFRGKSAGFFGDISAGLAKHLSDSFYRAFDMSRSSEKLLNEILAPFVNSSNSNKMQTLSILDEGSKFENLDGSIGKDFTLTEVMQRIPTGTSAKDTQQIMEGYLSVRMMADASHSIMNKSFKESLDAQGYKHYKVGDFETVGVRPTDEAMQGVKAYYDPTTGEVVENLSPKDIRALQAEGSQIVNVKGLHGNGGHQTNNVLIKATDSVAELPAQVLNYRPGYIPRMYKEHYYVTMRPKAIRINGETVHGRDVPSQTIAVARSKTAVDRMVAKMKLENPDMEIDFKHDRTLTAAGARASELDLHMNTNGLFYSKRGKHLAREGGELAETEDAVSSITRMAASVARRIELTPVIDLHKQRWLSKFGEMTNGKYPNTKDVIREQDKLTSDEMEAAISYWDYINMQEAGGTTSEAWRAMSIKFGEYLEGKTGSEGLGSFFRTSVADNDPLSAARAAVFMTTIVFNPVRQLFIQSQQALYLLGLKDVNLVEAYSTGMRLLLPTSKNATPEFLELQKAFKESGLVEAVDSNLLGRDAMFASQHDVTNSTVKKLSQAIGNSAKSVASTVRTVGFDAGEILNLSTTYTAAYMRWKKANPTIKTLTEKDKYTIAADARQLALGMTQAGGFKYQKGVLSLPMQFVSVQHKALLNTLTAINPKYGNKAITQEEGWRILGGQIFLYGSAGMGVSAVVDWGLEKLDIEISPEARNLYLGGVYDWTANMLLSSIDDTGGNQMFATSLAAGSGWYDTILDKVGEMMTSPAPELFAGPSSTLYSRLSYAVGITASALGAAAFSEEVDLEEEDIKELAHEWFSVFSLYNNVYRGTAMHKAQSFVDSNLTPIGVTASTKDAFLRAIIGVQTYEEDARFDQFNMLSNKKEKLTDVAAVYYKRVSRALGVLNRVDNYTPDSYLKTRRLMNKEFLTLRIIYGDEDARQIALKVQDMIKMKDDQGTGVFANHLADLATKGSAGKSVDQMITNGINGGLLEPEDGDKLRKLHDYLYKAEED